MSASEDFNRATEPKVTITCYTTVQTIGNTDQLEQVIQNLMAEISMDHNASNSRTRIENSLKFDIHYCTRRVCLYMFIQSPRRPICV